MRKCAANPHPEPIYGLLRAPNIRQDVTAA